jgi:hypothetical protein
MSTVNPQTVISTIIQRLCVGTVSSVVRDMTLLMSDVQCPCAADP